MFLWVFLLIISMFFWVFLLSFIMKGSILRQSKNVFFLHFVYVPKPFPSSLTLLLMLIYVLGVISKLCSHHIWSTLISWVYWFSSRRLLLAQDQRGVFFTDHFALHLIQHFNSITCFNTFHISFYFLFVKNPQVFVQKLHKFHPKPWNKPSLLASEVGAYHILWSTSNLGLLIAMHICEWNAEFKIATLRQWKVLYSCSWRLTWLTNTRNRWCVAERRKYHTSAVNRHNPFTTNWSRSGGLRSWRRLQDY